MRKTDTPATGAVIAYLASLTLAVVATRAVAGSFVGLESKPPIMRGVSALPKVVAGAEPTALKKINGELARADSSVRQDAKECLRERRAKWTRKIEATMQGPRYLSLVARDSYFCGSTYPDERLSAFVFDLTTGAPPDWKKLLPGLDLQIDSEAFEGVIFQSIASGKLSGMYRDLAKRKSHDSDCEKNLADYALTFNLWLDAKEKGLGVAPSELPHAIAACGVEVSITLASLKPSDVSTALSEAIAASK